MADHQMKGHGHVTPNPDGSRARCGGPRFCWICAIEAARTQADAGDLTQERNEIPPHTPPEHSLEALCEQLGRDNAKLRVRVEELEERLGALEEVERIHREARHPLAGTAILTQSLFLAPGRVLYQRSAMGLSLLRAGMDMEKMVQYHAGKGIEALLRRRSSIAAVMEVRRCSWEEAARAIEEEERRHG